MMFRILKAWYFVTPVLLIVIIVTSLFVLNRVKKPVLIEVERVEEWNWGNALHLQPSSNGSHQNSIFNLTLNYIVSAENCSNHPKTLAVFIVTSYFGNVETRSAMRRAFSSQDLQELSVKRVFLLGEAPGDNFTKQAAILDEAKRFGDVVQGNFLEAYRNLTYKHLMGLKWASEQCSNAEYIVKMDDDIVVDLRNFVSFLRTAKLPENLVAGYFLRGMKPIREPANKWYVTHEEYPYSTYPPFVSGWLYITTPQVAAKFVLLSHYTRYLWIDDLYVTGILARQLRIKHYDLGPYFAPHSELMQCCLRDLKTLVSCDFLIGPNGGDEDLYYTFNEALKLCDSGHCKNRTKRIDETCITEHKTNLKTGHSIIEDYRLF